MASPASKRTGPSTNLLHFRPGRMLRCLQPARTAVRRRDPRAFPGHRRAHLRLDTTGRTRKRSTTRHAGGARGNDRVPQRALPLLERQGARGDPGIQVPLRVLQPLRSRLGVSELFPISFIGPGELADSVTNHRHGDFCVIHPITGNISFLGRADGVLNPSGVRFGSAEIYSVIERRFADRVQDSLCVGQRRPQDQDETVMLFLLMKPGHRFDTALVGELREAIGRDLSKRHVPKYIFETPEIPVSFPPSDAHAYAHASVPI